MVMGEVILVERCYFRWKRGMDCEKLLLLLGRVGGFRRSWKGWCYGIIDWCSGCYDLVLCVDTR